MPRPTLCRNIDILQSDERFRQPGSHMSVQRDVFFSNRSNLKHSDCAVLQNSHPSGWDSFESDTSLHDSKARELTVTHQDGTVECYTP
jgi:hypothetical protein